MSYYENQQWTAAGGGQPQQWEQQTPPARSGASSAVPREDSSAFSTQLDEVDRAVDNLVKSGKMFPGAPARRESMPMAGPPRDFPQQFDPHRMGGGPPRHHSVSDFGDSRSFSQGSGLQNFYATQRHQPSRGANEAEQVMQAKRRMAAQRERELRNYHQEQQYNRSVLAEISTFGGKPDRTMSPSSGMSEDERRELIARQRSALYGEGAGFGDNGQFDENGTPRPGTQGSGTQSATGIRGHSPLAFDHYNSHSNQGQSENAGQQTSAEGQQQAQGQQRSRANSTSSPSSNPTSSFSLFESAAAHVQSSRTSTSSPGGSPPRNGAKGLPASSGVAPIGTRPAQAPNPALNKRSTTPLPSPLSFGFAANSEEDSADKTGRTASAASNPNEGLGWGSKSGVWGAQKNSLGVQASVWG